MDNCIFCKIISGEMPGNIVYEDDDHIALLDLFPVSRGHTMLIPKQHYVNIFDVDDKGAAAVYPKLAKLAKALKKATGCDGLNIVQNNGEVAGQVVFHAHIHLIPRYVDDAIKIAVASKDMADAAAQKELESLIKAALKA